jgi:hypothetical protein
LASFTATFENPAHLPAQVWVFLAFALPLHPCHFLLTVTPCSFSLAAETFKFPLFLCTVPFFPFKWPGALVSCPLPLNYPIASYALPLPFAHRPLPLPTSPLPTNRPINALTWSFLFRKTLNSCLKRPP